VAAPLALGSLVWEGSADDNFVGPLTCFPTDKCYMTEPVLLMMPRALALALWLSAELLDEALK